MSRKCRATLSRLILSRPETREYLINRLKVYGTLAMHNHG